MSIEKLQDKRTMWDEIDTIDIFDMESGLDELITRLEQCKDEMYTSYSVMSDTNFYDGDDGYAQITIKGKRLETDAEVEIRINAYNKAELDKFLREKEAEKKEKEKYLELKQKYEKELG